MIQFGDFSREETSTILQESTQETVVTDDAPHGTHDDCSHGGDDTCRDDSDITSRIVYKDELDDIPNITNNYTKLLSSLLTRGMLNSGNMCFLNATLQSLFHCSPFRALLQQLRSLLGGAEQAERRGLLLTSRCLQLLHDMTDDVTGTMSNRPLRPDYFYGVVGRFGPDCGYSKSVQEDAQEFLSYLLDTLNDELLQYRGTLPTRPGTGSDNDDDDSDNDYDNADDAVGGDGWLEVGKNNAVSAVSTISIDNGGVGGSAGVVSPVARLFFGYFRSVVRRPGQTASATKQPFNVLPLELPRHQRQVSLEQCLRHMAEPEVLDRHFDPKTKREMTATKQTLFEDLPPVLMLQLMRFAYDAQGPVKVHTQVNYNHTLTIPAAICVGSAKHAEQREYTLCAVIEHYGKYASRGHYVSLCRDDGSGDEVDSWVRFDDDKHEYTSGEQVQDKPGAYMLLYVRQGRS